jgi:hypothetical protein
LLRGGRRLMFADLYILAGGVCCGLLSVGHDPDKPTAVVRYVICNELPFS